MENENSSDAGRSPTLIDRRQYLKLTGAGTGLALGGAGASAFSASTAQAATTNGCSIDDFEDGNLNEYRFNSGAYGASVVSSPTYSGSQALALSDAYIEMVSTGGLDQYPSAGDTISCRLRAADGSANVAFNYGVQDYDNCFSVDIDFGDNTVIFRRYKDGSGTKLGEQTATIDLLQDVWYELEVDWAGNGEHTITLYDTTGTQVVHVTGTDSTFASGGIGFFGYLGSTNSTVYIDSISKNECEDRDHVVIDDFEDGDLSEYTVDRDGSGASIVSGTSYHGKNALEISGTNTELLSTSGLSNYPSQGDKFTTWVRRTNGATDINVTYGAQDKNNRYLARVDFDNGGLVLFRYQNGSMNRLAENWNLTVREDKWYQVEVMWSEGGDHRLALYDDLGNQLGQVLAADSTWTSGGFGYDAYMNSSGGTVYFDYAALEVCDCSNGEIIDNFEDGDISEYSIDRDGTGANVVSAPTYNGSYALEITATNTELLSTSGLDHYPSQGERFSTWVRGTNGATNINITYGAQDKENRYLARVDFDNDAILLYRYENGSMNKLAEKWTGFTLAADTWYRAEVEWTRDDNHALAIYTESDQLLGQVTATDSTWQSGGFGYDAYMSSSGGTVYFDYSYVNECDDSGAGTIVEGFEDGDLSEYWFDRGSSGASIVSSPTFNGSNALEISGTNTEMIRSPDHVVNPKAGDKFSCWVRATDGAGPLHLSYGVQDHKNRYFIRIDFANDNLVLRKLENDQNIKLAAKWSGFTLIEDSWYRVEIDWASSGQHTVRLYGGSLLAQISAIDTTWNEGSIGYDAYLNSSGGTVYFDELRLNEYSHPPAAPAVDDFSDGDLSEYSFTNGTGRTVLSPTYYGEYSLALGENSDLISTSGLPRYPEAGDRFRSSIRATGGASAAYIKYGVQDENNMYLIESSFENDRIAVVKIESGGKTTLADHSTGFSLKEDEWYRIEIDWDSNGCHSVMLLNDSNDLLSRISAIDSTFTQGGVGYGGDGGTVYVDHVLVERADTHHDLESQHGNLQDMSYSAMSADSEGRERAKTIYTYEDGTEYSVIHTKHKGGKMKREYNSNVYWESSPSEATNSCKRLSGGDK